MHITPKTNLLTAYSYARDIENDRPRTDGHPGSDAVRIKEDTVALSGGVREMHAAASQLTSIPDVRQDKVAALKQQVQSGLYRVDAKGVAAKLLQESILNQLA